MDKSNTNKLAPRRFIEIHKDGTATLNYPGWPIRHYRSAKAAYNQRRFIDNKGGSIAREKSARSWTEAEDVFVRAYWGLLSGDEWKSKMPSRTYAAIKTYAKKTQNTGN